ncbi:MAG: hypothetical protein U0R70_12705 [Solirubrobacteraceae bacterium]
MTRRRPGPMLALAALVAAAAAACAAGAVPADALFLLPMLALAVPLLAGRYLGEDALERWRARPDAPRRRARAIAAPRRPTRASAGGGLLLARHLSGRAPPAAALPAR